MTCANNSRSCTRGFRFLPPLGAVDRPRLTTGRLPHGDTHIHTHSPHTHPTRTCTGTQQPSHMLAYTAAHLCAQVNKLHAHVHTNALTCVHVYTRTHSHIHTNTHIYTHKPRQPREQALVRGSPLMTRSQKHGSQLRGAPSCSLLTDTGEATRGERPWPRTLGVCRR